MSHMTYNRLLETVHASGAFELLRAGLTLGLFEMLESGPLTMEEVSRQLRITTVRGQILSEGLLGLGLVEKGPASTINNCSAISGIIQRGELPVLAALVRFQAEIVSVGQRNFTETLIADRNEGLHYFPGEGDTLYARLEANPRLQRVFFDYMQIYTKYASSALVQAHDFSVYRRILDVGGGGGALAAKLAQVNPRADITLLDIDFARPSFEEQMAEPGMAAGLQFHNADMHREAFPPKQDLVTFVHQLVIWSPAENIELLRKAHQALIPGGTVVICSSMMNDDRSGPLMALLDAVYFQSVATGFGQIYSFSDYREWLAKAGFLNVREKRLETWTPHGMVIAKKPDRV